MLLRRARVMELTAGWQDRSGKTKTCAALGVWPSERCRSGPKVQFKESRPRSGQCDLAADTKLCWMVRAQ